MSLNVFETITDAMESQIAPAIISADQAVKISEHGSLG